MTHPLFNWTFAVIVRRASFDGQISKKEKALFNAFFFFDFRFSPYPCENEKPTPSQSAEGFGIFWLGREKVLSSIMRTQTWSQINLKTGATNGNM